MISKNKLLKIVQEEYRSFPTYLFVKDGPDDAPRFRASVSFCGLTFESPGPSRTLREAENAAADVALDVLCATPDDEPMQTIGSAVDIQIQSGEVHLNLQKEVNKEEMPQPPGSLPSTSESGVTNMLPTSGHKEQTAQLPQAPPRFFPSSSSRIQFVSVQELLASKNSGRGTNKQNMGNICSVSGNSVNGQNKEQANSIATGMLGKRKQTEELQEPEERKRKQTEDLQEPEERKRKHTEDLQEPEERKRKQTEDLQEPEERISIPQFCPVSGNSGNGRNKEQGNSIATGMLAKRKWTEDLQQPEERISITRSCPGKHKSQLNDLAMIVGCPPPVYSRIYDGLPHIPRFKATVEFDGQTFESPGFFNTLRDAENDAALAVLNSFSERVSTLVESPICKILLEVEAQNVGSSMPVYNTTSLNILCRPVFTSTVKFNGMEFKGQAANNKKQAENNAATVAWSALKEIKGSADSTVQVPDSKGEVPVCESNDHPLIQVISHLEEETTRAGLKGERSHLELTRSLSEVSLLEPSEAFKTESKKERVQNMTGSVLRNRDDDKIQQPSCRSLDSKYPPGTKIRVVPASESSSTKKWDVIYC